MLLNPHLPDKISLVFYLEAVSVVPCLLWNPVVYVSLAQCQTDRTI